MSDQRVTSKGALRRLFLSLLCCASTACLQAAGPCLPEALDETGVAVSWNHDGDTIKLEDGRRVRLIGIDTPELAKNNKPSQPFASRARQQLRDLLEAGDMVVSLRYGEDRHDRYGRLLAHVISGEGATASNLNARMVEDGMAVAISVPPNDRLAECYLDLEAGAREAERGIWSHARYQPVASSQLLRQGTGFRIIEARIDEVTEKRKGIWLRDLPLQVYIARRDLEAFDAGWLRSLQGERVRVRGWVKKDRYSPADKRFMMLRHPTAIEIID